MKRFLSALVCCAFSYAIAGCAKAPESAPAPTPTAPPATSGAKDHGHDHPAHGAGPHGGTLTDWGGGAYHVEFKVDHDKKEATVYVLGSDEKSPAPVKAEKIQLSINEPAFQLELKAQPLEGEKDGKSSRFVGTHDNLGKVQEFAGTLSGEVDGTPYTGDFKEEPHSDHPSK